jgi:hypothetical protein
MQGMIRDFFGIKKRTLNEEIKAVQDSVSPEVWAAIDAVRHVGNVSAHWDADVDRIVDVDPEEVESLLALLDMFGREWYAARAQRAALLEKVKGIGDAKRTQPSRPPAEDAPQ